MTIRVDLLALQPSVPGQARLVIKKWQGAEEQLEFSIQRNQDHYFLQDGRQWSNNAFWFKVARFTASGEGDSLEALVGAEVVDPLLEGSSSSNYRFVLRNQDGSQSDDGVIRPGSGLLLSSSEGATRSTGGSAELSEPLDIPRLPELNLAEVAPSAPVTESVVAPAAEPTATASSEPAALSPPQKKAWLLPLVLLLLVLLGAAAAAWFWFSKDAVEPSDSAAVASESNLVAPAAEPASPCAVENMGSLSELAFVQGCVKQAPSSAELLEVIASAKAGKHCGIAQRLYANRSQAGDVEIARAYAREYDPKYHQASECFAEPDAATAAYWYETILGSMPDDAEAKQRFEELKP